MQEPTFSGVIEIVTHNRGREFDNNALHCESLLYREAKLLRLTLPIGDKRLLMYLAYRSNGLLVV